MGLKLENSEMREHLGAEDPACRALAETVVWIVDEQHVRVPPSVGAGHAVAGSLSLLALLTWRQQEAALQKGAEHTHGGATR